jgi:hypothetical protein
MVSGRGYCTSSTSPWPLDEVEFSTAQFERTADDHIRN